MPLQDADKPGRREQLVAQRRELGAYDPARLFEAGSRHGRIRKRRVSSKSLARLVERQDASMDPLLAADVLPSPPDHSGAASDLNLPGAPDHSGADSDPTLPSAPDHSGATPNPKASSSPDSASTSAVASASMPAPSDAGGAGAMHSDTAPGVPAIGTAPIAGPSESLSHQTTAVLAILSVAAAAMVALFFFLRSYRQKLMRECEAKESCQLTRTRTQRLGSFESKHNASSPHHDSSETLVNVPPACDKVLPHLTAMAAQDQVVQDFAASEAARAVPVTMPRPLDPITEVQELPTGVSTSAVTDDYLSPKSLVASPTRSAGNRMSQPITSPRPLSELGKINPPSPRSYDREADRTRGSGLGAGMRLAVSRPHSSKGRPQSSKGRDIEMTRKGSQLVIRDRPSTATLSRPISRAGTSIRSALRRTVDEEPGEDEAIYIETEGIVGRPSHETVLVEAPAACSSELSVPATPASRREQLQSRFSNSTLQTARRVSSVTAATASPTGSFSYEIKDAVRQTASTPVPLGASSKSRDEDEAEGRNAEEGRDSGGMRTGGSSGNESFVQELDWTLPDFRVSEDGYPPFVATRTSTS